MGGEAVREPRSCPVLGASLVRRVSLSVSCVISGSGDFSGVLPDPRTLTLAAGGKAAIFPQENATSLGRSRLSFKFY